MFDHGEAVVRSYFEQIPDGRYVGQGVMDDNGITSDEVPFEVAVEVDGSTVRVDYTNVPDQHPGPINTPIPSTVSASRIAIALLAGGGEWPNEGHFRPLEVVARPGSMFHPLPPAPCFLYAWPTFQAMEAIYNAIAKALPRAVPGVLGRRHRGARVVGRRRGGPASRGPTGLRTPIGQGASVHGDGASCLIHHGEASTRFSPTEVWESKNPWLLEKVELAQDSCGPGEHRGGLGVDFFFHALAGLLRHLRGRADEERAVGARGRRLRATERRRAEACGREPLRVRQGDAAARSQGCDARAVHGRGRRVRRACEARSRSGACATCARATSASSTRGRTTRTRSPRG